MNTQDNSEPKSDQFETDYLLEQFREIQDSHFGSDGKKYHAVPIGAASSELMLKLINQLESEVLELRSTPSPQPNAKINLSKPDDAPWTDADVPDDAIKVPWLDAVEVAAQEHIKYMFDYSYKDYAYRGFKAGAEWAKSKSIKPGKSLDECKDEVARSSNFDDWNHCLRSVGNREIFRIYFDQLVNEAAELYALQSKK